jgi:hypothetical protein
MNIQTLEGAELSKATGTDLACLMGQVTAVLQVLQTSERLDVLIISKKRT